MHKWTSAVAALGISLCASRAHSQIMSNKSTDNPSTRGYASSETANKGQTKAGTKPTSHKWTRAARSRPAGTSPAESAGASTPNGPCPANLRDSSQLSAACPPGPNP